jgi:hypothetical protein
MKTKKAKSIHKSRKFVFTLLVLVAIIGSVATIFTFASSPWVEIDLEKASIVSPAKVTSDSSAANGAYVQFGSAATSSQGLAVAGNRITKDGKTYIAKGFNSVGRLAPTWCSKGLSKTARENFGQPMFDKMKQTWKADAIRFQVSQTGLDPQQRSDSGAYIDHIKNGVNLARQNGMVVILSMQDQSLSCGDAHRLPSSETVRAWQQLAPQFKDNNYVMFELFNEPQSQISDADWNQWRNGGSSPTTNTAENGGATYNVVGHQQVLEAIRATGAKNIIIADGANKSGKFQGMYQSSSKNYMLKDTLAIPQVAYAFHPYYFHISNNSSYANDSASWETRFGYLVNDSKVPASIQAPLLNTEWNTSGVNPCYSSVFGRTPEFFAWMKQRNIGSFPQAIDIADSSTGTPGSVVRTVPGWEPTRFETGKLPCQTNTDAGEALIDYYSSYSN